MKKLHKYKEHIKVRQPSWITSLLKFFHVFDNYVIATITSFFPNLRDTYLEGWEELQSLPNSQLTTVHTHRQNHKWKLT